MPMPTPARVCLGAGVGAIVLVLINQLTAPSLSGGGSDPALERAGLLAAMLAVGLMLVAALWTQVVPEPAQRAGLQGEEGLVLASDLPAELAAELAWGSRMLLTATPAAVVLVHWRDQTLLQRGLLRPEQQPAEQQIAKSPPAFAPGPICQRARQRQTAISLVDLRLYPGRQEFDALLPELPAVLVQPLGQEGWLLLGGWSARCFSRSDLAWVEGWAARLTGQLANAADWAAGPAADPDGPVAPPPGC